MGNGDSSFTPTAGTAPRRSRGAEPASARSWWRTKGRSHAHRHASSCAFESLRGRGHQEEGGACNQGVESYWCDSPWGAGDNVFLDTGSFSAHFSAAHTSSSPPADGAASHASCSSSARTEDSGLGDSLILRTEGAEQLEGAWSSLHHAHTSTTSGGSSSAPCGSGRKDFLKIRIRQLGDWTGSLSRKKRRVQAPYGSDSELVDCGTLWTSNPLHTLNQDQGQDHDQIPAGLCGSTRSLHPGSDLQRLNVYASFMQELQMGRPEPEEEEEEEEEEEGNTDTEEEEEQEVGGGGEQQDLLVRRAGRLSFKPLLTLSPDRKLQLVSCRRWRSFWVTLRGCTLLLYQTPSRGTLSSEQQQQQEELEEEEEEQSTPRYTLLADGGIVQAVPEHPRREHVFCLSNSHGDVYLFQATNQSDLETWVTALHSASAALLARRQGATDTLRLLRRRSRSLLQRIDADGRMRKMAELQLSVIREPRSRRAVQSQIQQWEQNLEQLHLQLFQLRCYQSSLQGGELPNPKSLLAAASRPSKSMLGRLGVFSVSSFHALVCSREEAGPAPPRPLGGLRGRSLPVSLRTLDRRSRCATSQARGHAHSAQDLHSVSSGREEAPPAGPAADVQVMEEQQPPPFHIFSLQVPQPVAQVFPLYQTFREGRPAVAAADLPGNPYIKEAGLPSPSPAHLSTCQRLRKVIQELVETEQSYVQDLVRLLDIYLAPLQQENFLSSDEMEALFGSLPEMLDFQKVFLQTLVERVASCPDLGSLETPGQLQALLCSLGGSFLDYADHFKHYSGFCVSHIKVQKVLERARTDAAFKHFLEARNPTNQHSASLESYLIKPVQRVLRYPLLLRELVCLTQPRSPEHTQLTEALRAMEKVASHINEMQKIYEDFGSVFEQLAAEQSRTRGRPAHISMGQFLVQTSALWTNPLPCLGRLRRAPELTLFVFKQAVVLVQQDSSRLKKWTSGSRSAGQDPSRFRWLIPVPDLQVRPSTGSEDPCVWELLHCRSEAEGRPQTIFSLRSSCPESKAAVLRALRCLRSDCLRNHSATWRRRRRRQEVVDDGEGEGLRRRLTSSEPLLPGHAHSPPRTRLCSLTGQLEAQLQRLHFTEEEGAGPEGEEARGWSPAHLLDRDFSVHSLASIVSEDCFYHSTTGSRGRPAPPRASTLVR